MFNCAIFLKRQTVRIRYNSPLAKESVGTAADSSSAGSLERLVPDALLIATPLGDGIVASGLSPTDALNVFQDLKRARSGVRLDTDLHLLFLVTPVTGTTEPDWAKFLAIHERLPTRERAVADAVGISHEFLMRESRGQRGPIASTTIANWHLERERTVALHRRFWASLALSKLMAEQPLATVALEHRMPRGALCCI